MIQTKLKNIHLFHKVIHFHRKQINFSDYYYNYHCCCFDHDYGGLTGFLCRGRHSKTPPLLAAQLEAGWHKTKKGCVSRYDRPCVCTAPCLRVHPCTAGFPESPPHFPHHSSPLCSSSAGTQTDETGQLETDVIEVTYCLYF